MTSKDNRPKQAAELRRQAEAKLSERQKKAAAPPMAESDTQRMVHQQEVYQIELEMQNEELLQSCAQVEAGLRLYTDLYDFAPVGYLSLARDGAIHKINLAVANLLGVERGALINRRFGLFVSVESLPIFNAFLEKVFESRKNESCEIALLKDGHETRWAQIEGTCIEDGRECRAVVSDITERKRAQEMLLRINKAVESSSDAIGISDAQGHHLYHNKAFTEMFGYTVEELEAAGGGPAALANKDIAQKAIRYDNERETWSGEVEMVSKSGRKFPVLLRADVIRDEGGGIVGLVGVHTDNTERRRLTMELNDLQQEQLRTKDRFISHVSHEFRSPLASIYQFTTILLDGLAGDISPEQREHLEIILRNVHQLRSMVDDLLEVNRAAAGKLTIDLRCIAPAEMIEGVVETFRLSGTKAMRFSADIPGDLPPVLADPARVREVITNLLDNAVKYTPDNGSIAVQAEIYSQDPNFICIKVSDTGCGISHEEIGNIFDYLYQVDSMIASCRKGLGLGLHISKELVSKHGGRIWAESEPGFGSTFFFTLPIFSLSRLLAPIMTEVKVATGSIAIVAVEVLPVEKRALTRNDESALLEAWNAVRGCIRPSKDVLLPMMPSTEQGAVFCAVLWANQRDAEALAGRIEEHLACCQSLRNTGLNPAIFTSMLDIPAGTARKPSEEIMKKIVDKVEEQTKIAMFEGRLK
jgi:PAS domain S-box-containing protein